MLKVKKQYRNLNLDIYPFGVRTGSFVISRLVHIEDLKELIDFNWEIRIFSRRLFVTIIEDLSQRFRNAKS